MPDFDTSVPHIARIYDYWLGGKDNFAADREAAERAMAATPTIVPGVRANRRFLGRAVRYMAEAGIRQFLDIGTGIPTANNTHEVAQAVAPEARVVYVDNDPIVLSHARALLTSTSAPIAYIDADARDTAKILAEAAELLDLSQPTDVGRRGPQELTRRDTADNEDRTDRVTRITSGIRRKPCGRGSRRVTNALPDQRTCATPWE